MNIDQYVHMPLIACLFGDFLCELFGTWYVIGADIKVAMKRLKSIPLPVIKQKCQH